MDRTILARLMLGPFCSVRCPGALTLETYDLATRLRARGGLVVSGFHSLMEQECLRILLKSEHRVIWCLARGMLKRIPPGLRDAVNDGRLLICTPFPESPRRVTGATAVRRNTIVAKLPNPAIE